MIPKPDSTFGQINPARNALLADNLVEEPSIEVDLNLLGEALNRSALDVDDLKQRPFVARGFWGQDEVRPDIGEGGEFGIDAESTRLGAQCRLVEGVPVSEV